VAETERGSPLLDKWRLIASLALCMGIVTALHTQAIQPVPPTPIDMKKVELGGMAWNPQWNFSPRGRGISRDVTTLELVIVPDISRVGNRASLESLRLS
jgi:hypothetical protein